jgi:integrase
MGEILLSELIERTKDSIRSLEHSQSTLYQYQMAWGELSEYFSNHHQVLFSKSLAEQYVCETKAKLEAGAIKKWRYMLRRLTVRMLIEVHEQGHFTWNHQQHDSSTYLHQSAFILLYKDYLSTLEEEGKGAGTVQTYKVVSRQFLEYLEERKVTDLAEVEPNEVGLFIPYISKLYQPSSMRTVLSALRSFLRFVESRDRAELRLSRAVPSGSGRITKVFPTITAEEEQKLLLADRTTPLGKRNYAMLLLALRTGLRSIDIANLKLGDIEWEKSAIEIVQAKTGAPLVLPLLTDVGNAIADYILNGRPDSQQPNIFLRSQAPYRRLSAHSAGYGVSCKMMKAAGIRQGKGERKGFHCFRHYVAERLLAEETPLPIISSILGHRNKDSTKIYLSTDLEHLQACALNLKGIEVTKEELQ